MVPESIILLPSIPMEPHPHYLKVQRDQVSKVNWSPAPPQPAVHCTPKRLAKGPVGPLGTPGAADLSKVQSALAEGSSMDPLDPRIIELYQ